MNIGGGYTRTVKGANNRLLTKPTDDLLARKIKCGRCTATFRERKYREDHERRFHTNVSFSGFYLTTIQFIVFAFM
jgi:hypothetical protein